MNNMILSFIKDHIDDIDANEWNKIYGSIPEELFSEIGKLTEVFVEAGIDPHDYLSVLPHSYLRNAQLSNKTFVVPSNIDIIYSEAFRGSNLENIVINEGCSHLYRFVFRDCTNLKSVTLPSTLKQIDFGCFVKASQVQEIIYNGTYDQFRRINLSHFDTNDSWFGLLATLGNTNCILRCTDIDYKIHVEF